MMNLDEYRAKLAKDPEYQGASKELKLMLNIADRILDLRIERGWTQLDLAVRLGATELYVAELEAGLANPTVWLLERLAVAFEVELKVKLG